MFRRIDRLAGAEGVRFLLNPLTTLRKDELLVVLAALRQFADGSPTRTGIVVFCDKGNLPLGYLLPRSLIDDARYLVLLSCSDAALDATALATFYSCSAITLAVDVSISGAMTNGFFGGEYLRPNEAACRHALEVLNAARIDGVAPGAMQTEVRRLRRDAIPLYAFVSHHAGDVLFVTLASRLASGIFQGIVVHRDYAAICQRAGLRLDLLEFSGPVVHRGGYSRDDPEHFLETLPSLPGDRFYVYARPSRDYNSTDHHLIDHYSYLLGASMVAVPELDGGRPVSSPPAACARPLPTLAATRILLHFGAGWPLKIYPADWQRALAEMLRQRGYELTVLDGADTIPGCRNVRFESIDQLEALLAEHRLLVGMDSFPAHFASLLGLASTLCLFSSTHPVHSRTATSSAYRWLSEELGCAPCRGSRQCPRYGGDVCRNFSPPERVCREIEAMLAKTRAIDHDPGSAQDARAAGIASAKPDFAHLPSATILHRLRPIRGTTVRIDPERLDYQELHRVYRAMLALRLILRVFGLVVEYVVAVRDQGFWRANALTKEFLARVFRRIRQHVGRQSPRAEPKGRG
jgi:hypothetical protein